LTWTQFVLWLSSGFVDMGGGERTLILCMNTVFPCCYEYESEDGCFADAAMCRCRVPLSALLSLQGGSSNMMRIALQHLLIGAAKATRRK
jgi:hypothetical protein